MCVYIYMYTDIGSQEVSRLTVYRTANILFIFNHLSACRIERVVGPKVFRLQVGCAAVIFWSISIVVLDCRAYDVILLAIEELFPEDKQVDG